MCHPISPEQGTSPQPVAMQPRTSRRSWWSDAVDFVFPPVCLICGRNTADGRGLCPECLDELIDPDGEVCLRCSAPVGPYLNTRHGCHHCRSDRFAFDRVVALGSYQGLLGGVCLRAKRDRSGLLARRMGELLAERWSELFSTEPVELIVPVPEHWTTRLVRPGLPADGIAAALSRVLGVPWSPHVLRKVRRTPAQLTLKPSQRRDNLKGAFALVRGVRLTAHRVLLVDDVLTTGTTAHRAALVLRSGGAASVRVAVVARGLGE